MKANKLIKELRNQVYLHGDKKVINAINDVVDEVSFDNETDYIRIDQVFCFEIRCYTFKVYWFARIDIQLRQLKW